MYVADQMFNGKEKKMVSTMSQLRKSSQKEGEKKMTECLYYRFILPKIKVQTLEEWLKEREKNVPRKS